MQRERRILFPLRGKRASYPAIAGKWEFRLLYGLFCILMKNHISDHIAVRIVPTLHEGVIQTNGITQKGSCIRRTDRTAEIGIQYINRKGVVRRRFQSDSHSQYLLRIHKKQHRIRILSTIICNQYGMTPSMRQLINIKTNILIFSLFPQMKAFAAGIWNTQRIS